MPAGYTRRSDRQMGGKRKKKGKTKKTKEKPVLSNNERATLRAQRGTRKAAKKSAKAQRAAKKKAKRGVRPAAPMAQEAPATQEAPPQEAPPQEAPPQEAPATQEASPQEAPPQEAPVAQERRSRVPTNNQRAALRADRGTRKATKKAAKAQRVAKALTRKTVIPVQAVKPRRVPAVAPAPAPEDVMAIPIENYKGDLSSTTIHTYMNTEGQKKANVAVKRQNGSYMLYRVTGTNNENIRRKAAALS